MSLAPLPSWRLPCLLPAACLPACLTQQAMSPLQQRDGQSKMSCPFPIRAHTASCMQYHGKDAYFFAFFLATARSLLRRASFARPSDPPRTMPGDHLHRGQSSGEAHSVYTSKPFRSTSTNAHKPLKSHPHPICDITSAMANSSHPIVWPRPGPRRRVAPSAPRVASSKAKLTS